MTSGSPSFEGSLQSLRSDLENLDEARTRVVQAIELLEPNDPEQKVQIEEIAPKAKGKFVPKLAPQHSRFIERHKCYDDLAGQLRTKFRRKWFTRKDAAETVTYKGSKFDIRLSIALLEQLEHEGQVEVRRGEARKGKVGGGPRPFEYRFTR